jgi:5-formyltetrahydrofolate cyclo-ligase
MALTKPELRAQLLASRKALPPEEVTVFSAHVCEKLAEILTHDIDVIAGYWPINNEVDITPFLMACHGYGKRIVLPTIPAAEMTMHFVSWEPGDEMKRSALGTLEPANGKPQTPDLVLAPLVGFDRRGHRIGYGKGYYDKTLLQLRQLNPRAKAVGVAYGFQEVPNVPQSAFDQRLNGVVTDREVILWA